ncbi:hypothetical protein [Planomonospora alba]
MTGTTDGLRRFTGHEETPGDPITDSIHRLVLAGGRGSRAVLDDLSCALFNVVSDTGLAEQALDVLAGAEPRTWIELDAALRSWTYGYHGPRSTPRAVAKMSNPLAVLLAACGRDGREREKALAHPAMRVDARLAPVLAIRTVDWVGAVRRRALRTLAEALSGADAAALRAVVPVAVRLGERHRGQALTDLVRDAVLRADAGTLHAVRRSEDLRARRFVLEVALQAGRMDREQLVEAALVDDHRIPQLELP